MEIEHQEGTDKIVSLILEESKKVKNPDPVSRIETVCGLVTTKIMLVMEGIREEERRHKK